MILRKLKTTLATSATPPIPLDQGAVPWLLAVALASALPHTEHLPLWLSLVAATALIARFGFWHQQVRLPPPWILIPLITTGIIGILLEFRTLLGKEAGVALLFFFMAIKPLESKERRDAIVIIMLGFFLLLTHFLYSQSIPTGLWLLATATLLSATLIRIYGGNQPLTAIVRYAATLMLQAMPFMLVLFVLFPRIPGPLWGLPRDAPTGLTGLSDQMSPGSLSNLILSGEIAFRVQFTGEVPDRSFLYWRGPVYENYDGRTWRTHPASMPAPREGRVIEATGNIVDYIVTLEPHNHLWLLALDMPISYPEESFVSGTFGVHSKTPVRQRVRHHFRSALEHTINPEEQLRFIRRSLSLPDNLNPQARKLAETWRAEFTTSEKISDAALSYFRNESFLYTLQPPLLGQHAVDDFLFSSRQGFCEHFAAAYVFLMRAAGVPARVVAGYQGGEFNPIDGHLVVRQSDAHAWAEIWIAGRGWLRVDPTFAVAPLRIEQGINAALAESGALPMRMRLNHELLRALRHRIDAINNAWNQWVLAYDSERQQRLLRGLGFENVDWRGLVLALTLLSTIALLIVMFWTLRPKAPASPVERAWRTLCKKLKAHGVIKENWEGPYDFAAKVSRERPDLTPVVSEAAECYARLWYGQGQPELLKKLEQCIHQLPPSRRK